MGAKTISKSNSILNQREYLEKKVFLESYPRFAWFALTGRCNLRCKHCPRVGEIEDNEDINDEVYRKFCNEILPKLESVKLGANNYGEQLLSYRVSDFLDQASKQSIKTIIHTNGTLLRGEIMEKIIETNTDVYISLEGTDDNYYNIRHVKYEAVEKKIKDLIRLRNEANRDLKVALAFTMFKGNLDDLYMLLRIGADEIGIGPVLPKDETWQELAFTDDELLEIKLNFIPSLMEYGEKHRTKIIFKKTVLSNNVVKAALSCSAPWNSINVRENGDVLPCCIAGDNLILGNLNKTNFKDIWNNRRYRALRNSFVKGRLKSTCSYCMENIDLRYGKTTTEKLQKLTKSILLKYELYGTIKFLKTLRRKILS